MRWEDQRQSGNVLDVRGSGGGMGGAGGLGIGATIVLGLVGWALGIDPRILIGGAQVVTGGRSPPTEQVARPPADDVGRFVSAVLAQTEDVFGEIFPAQIGRRYVAPQLVLFSGTTRSACGAAQTQTGPFYCPNDRRVYLDMAFFEELKRRFGAPGRYGPGSFAVAYVIAHEVGHHIQNQLGVLEQLASVRGRVDERTLNGYQVRVELQADCYAGVWAHHAQRRFGTLEPGDLEQALQAAAAVGDDNIQRRTQGVVVPESFTHGSSAQRVRWFRQGFQTGEMRACDTLRARQL